MQVRCVGLRRELLGALLALAACSGGSGGGGSSAPVDTPFADTAAVWWSAGSGAQWRYRMVDARAGGRTVSKTVTDLGETVLGGRTVHRFDHSWSMFDNSTETEYRWFDGNSIRNVAASSDVPGWTGPLDYAELPAPMKEGVAQSVYDASQAVDVDGDGRADTLRVQVTVTPTRVATLSVAAGDFRNVVSARQDIKVTITLAAGASNSATAVLTTWYAPGVGIVRRVYVDPSATAPNDTVTEELVGVSVGSVRAGLLAPATVLDGIGWGGDSSAPPATAVVTAADRYLVATVAQAGTIEASIVDKAGAAVWRGTALTPPVGFRYGGVAAAWDGSDFRVVGVYAMPYTSPNVYTVQAQRVSTTGALRDGAAGTMLDTGVPDASHSLAALRVAARSGQVLAMWGRYDPTYVTVAPGLVNQRGYIAEGRLFGAQHQALSAKFDIGAGIPAALALREPQYIALALPQVLDARSLVAWAVDAGGVPLGTTGSIVSSTATVKDAPMLSAAGSDLWLTWREWPQLGAPANTPRAARLGAGAALLDGAPDAPGRALLPAGDARAPLAQPWIGRTQSMLGWIEGWNTVRATFFDTSLLAGGTALPTDAVTLSVDDPAGIAGAASRAVLWAGDFDGGTMIVWLDNVQTPGEASDRVQVVQLRPRLVQ
jgi:hypothetical protein